MSFWLLKGRFAPQLGQPDGDSVRFIPDDPAPLFRLRRRGAAPGINAENGSVQLRYEGIDCLEKAAIQPYSSDATASNLGLVAPPQSDARGYICTNQLDPHGRPVCFVFSGDIARTDGTRIRLDPADIATSVNATQLERGHAYPLFYDTLYADLRLHLAAICTNARQSGAGVWSADATTSGFAWNSDLAGLPPIFPKLWRRIDTYRRDETFFDPNDPTANLQAYIASLREERASS
ncbi:hypothetical protein SAMN03159496_03413 [Rhizobium sp. NFR07]|uniref:hypothetical protein n=1 Tax=Rhizobium sp. NFR07 TaxID=1566262 RepID=UPI0008E23471|nr:hypothetical protein [Rhizobium sp. NFR07]SFB39516.1 hypothetical protein SAMN03159496_03413 [Rhizobium sp. NFR07]